MQRRTRIVAMATTAMLAAGAAPAAAETVVGLTDTDKLVAFDSATPGTVAATLAVSGVTAGDDLVGIDYRPATLQLYALGENGTSGQLYRIDTITGQATAVGGRLQGLDGSAEYDIDFNPAIDRLRVTSSGDLSLVVNPNDGSLQATAPELNPGDPTVVGSAYDNNHPASGAYPGPATTTLYAIDAGTDALYVQNAATSELTGAQDLGVDVAATLGFDISTAQDSAETGYVVVRAGGSDAATFHTIDLSNGNPSAGTPVGGPEEVADIAVAPPAPLLITLNSGTPQSLSVLSAERPGAVTPPVVLTGLQPGEKLLAIDTRPSDGVLYGLGSASRLYTLDLRTGAATVVGSGAFTPALASAPYGFDFNPTSGAAALRLLEGEANSTLSAAAAAHTAQNPLSYTAGDPNAGTTPDVRHAAYTKAVTGPPATRLFGIDTALDDTVEQGQATAFGSGAPDFNASERLTTVGDLGVDANQVGGLEAVDRFDQLFAALQTQAGGSTLYTVNGRATAAGQRANGQAIAAGDIGLPANVVVEGLARFTATSGSPAPQPTATPTSPYYEVPTPQPTVTPDPQPAGKARVQLKRVRVTPKRDRRKPYRFRVRGTADPVGKARRAAAGRRLRIVVKRAGSKQVRLNTRARVRRNGTFSKRVVVRRPGARRGRLSFRVQYLGNAQLRKSRKVVRSVAYGPKRS